MFLVYKKILFGFLKLSFWEGESFFRDKLDLSLKDKKIDFREERELSDEILWESKRQRSELILDSLVSTYKVWNFKLSENWDLEFISVTKSSYVMSNSLLEKVSTSLWIDPNSLVSLLNDRINLKKVLDSSEEFSLFYSHLEEATNTLNSLIDSLYFQWPFLNLSWLENLYDRFYKHFQSELSSMKSRELASSYFDKKLKPYEEVIISLDRIHSFKNILESENDWDRFLVFYDFFSKDINYVKNITWIDLFSKFPLIKERTIKLSFEKSLNQEQKDAYFELVNRWFSLEVIKFIFESGLFRFENPKKSNFRLFYKDFSLDLSLNYFKNSDIWQDFIENPRMLSGIYEKQPNWAFWISWENAQTLWQFIRALDEQRASWKLEYLHTKVNWKRLRITNDNKENILSYFDYASKMARKYWFKPIDFMSLLDKENVSWDHKMYAWWLSEEKRNDMLSRWLYPPSAVWIWQMTRKTWNDMVRLAREKYKLNIWNYDTSKYDPRAQIELSAIYIRYIMDKHNTSSFPIIKAFYNAWDKFDFDSNSKVDEAYSSWNSPIVDMIPEKFRVPFISRKLYFIWGISYYSKENLSWNDAVDVFERFSKERLPNLKIT